MVITTYSVSQPYHELILACIVSISLIASCAIVYSFGLKAILGVIAIVVIWPIIVISAVFILTYEHGLGGILTLDIILPLCLISLPPALIGTGIGFGLRRLVKVHAGRDG